MMKICNFLRAYNAHKLLLYLKRVAERKYLFDQAIGLYQSLRIASFANPNFFLLCLPSRSSEDLRMIINLGTICSVEPRSTII